MKKIIVAFVCIWFLSGYAHTQNKGNTTNDSFNKAKRIYCNRFIKAKEGLTAAVVPFRIKNFFLAITTRQKKRVNCPNA